MIVRLSWTEGAPGQIGDGFRVYRSVNGGAYSLLATLPLSQTTYDDSNVSYGNVYRYRVVEYCADQESEPAEIGAFFFQYSESASASDTLDRRPGKGAQETCPAGDALSRAARRLLEDWAACGEILSKAPRRPLAEACTLGDWREPFALARAPAESLPLAAVENRAASRALTATLGLNVHWTRGLGHTEPEWLLLEDGDSLALTRTLYENLPAVLLYERSAELYKDIDEAIAAGDELSRALACPFPEVLALTFVRTRGLSRPLIDMAYLGHAPSWPVSLARALEELAAIAESATHVVAYRRTVTELLGTSDALWRRGLVRSRAERTSLSDARRRRLGRLLEEAPPIEALSTYKFGRAPSEVLPLDLTLTRVWRRTAPAQLEVWARLAAPARSTSYPWDTGKGGLFTRKLPRSLAESILRRGLVTAEHARALTFLLLLREAIAKKLKREVSLSKPLR